jgi:hypothetical protein
MVVVGARGAICTGAVVAGVAVVTAVAGVPDGLEAETSAEGDDSASEEVAAASAGEVVTAFSGSGDISRLGCSSIIRAIGTVTCVSAKAVVVEKRLVFTAIATVAAEMTAATERAVAVEVFMKFTIFIVLIKSV